ncbi:MAG: hypothetical protein RIS88_1459 [Pseudomonadota bacterium]|jgi:hypothetical protein
MGSVPTRLLLGTEEPVPATRLLRAGPLQVRLRGTRLLVMDVGGHEVWHGAAFLYRDEGWGTPESVADHTSIDEREDGFTVRIEGHIPARERIDLRIEIRGEADGLLVYEARAVPRADLPANRVGLCVLHPPSAFGRRIEVTHVDGRTSTSCLPLRVAPWPPFMLVRALRHEYADGAWASCLLEGDSFELEDQRNNADASFKTYSRSNLMPRPFMLFEGQAVCQRMTLRVEAPVPAPRAPCTPVLAASGTAWPMPAIGVGIAVSDVQAGVPAPLSEAVRELAPARLHLRLRSPQEAVNWRGLGQLLAVAGARLRLDVETLEGEGAPAALGALAAVMTDAGVAPAEVAVFPGTPAVLAVARQAFPGASIGSGTPHFFAQLNRVEGLGAVDFLAFSIASIVHGADDDGVMHGLQSLPWLLETLDADHPQVPVHTGPSAIAVPRSPLGIQPEGDGVHRIALARRDPRTCAMFGAAWTLGHVAALAGAGARAVSVLDLQGDQGILAGVGDEVLRRRPAFFVLQALASATDLRRVDTGLPGQLAAVWVQRPGQGVLLLANLTGVSRHLPLPAWARGRPLGLDPLAIAAGARVPWKEVSLTDGCHLHLAPWAVLRLEGVVPEGASPVPEEKPSAS